MTVTFNSAGLNTISFASFDTATDPGEYRLNYKSTIGPNEEAIMEDYFYFDIIFCDYDTDHSLTDFVTDPAQIKLYFSLAFPHTLTMTYPYF